MLQLSCLSFPLCSQFFVIKQPYKSKALCLYMHILYLCINLVITVQDCTWNIFVKYMI